MATFVVYGVLLLPLSPIELLAGFLSPSTLTRTRTLNPNPVPLTLTLALTPTLPPAPNPAPDPNPNPKPGFLFPFWTALAVCVAGKVTSSGICFVIGRTVGAGFAWA